MNIELAYTDDFARAELAFGYQLAQHCGETVTLNEAQRFTALSVLHGLEQAVLRDRAVAQAAGQEFDRDGWLPADDVVAQMQEVYRPHRRFLRGVDGLYAYIAGIREGTVTFEEPLYDHQEDTLARVADNLAANDPFGESSQGTYADISGGGGKSRIITMLTTGFKYLEDAQDPNRVLVIVPDSAVQQEVVGEDGQSGFGKYAQHIKPGQLNKERKDYDSDVLVATRESARRMLEADPTAFERYDLIIADDAHILTSEKTRAVVSQVRRRIVGLTGSPDYSDDRRLVDLLPDRLLRLSTRELILNDKLSPVQLWICKTGQVVYQEKDRLEYTQQELDRIAAMPERHQIAADIGLALFRDNRNGIFACNNIYEAQELARALDGTVVRLADGRERTIRIRAVHGKAEDNHASFRALQADEIQGITIVDIETGWDVPRASFLVNLRPSKVRVRPRQRFARIVRRFVDADGQVVTAQAVDMVDTIRPSRRDKQNERLSVRQTLVPELLGETHYHAGKVIAAPGTDGRRRDFAVSQFPPHIRRAMLLTDGLPLNRVPIFGAGAVRERRTATERCITLDDAQLGLGVTATRLRVALLAIGVRPKSGLLDEAALNQVAQYFLHHNEPIV